MVSLKKRQKKSHGHWSVSLGYHGFLLLAATISGNLFAFFITKAGQIDQAVLGPLHPPLSIALAFVFYGFGAGFHHRTKLARALDPYLPNPEGGLRILCAIVAMATILEILRIFLFMFIDYWPTDLPSYYYAGLAIAKQKNPYDADLLTSLAGKRIFPYLYPPFLAACFRFFSAVPIELASTIWQCCTVIALLTSIFLCLRLAQPSLDSARTGAIITALVVPLGLPFYMTAQHGSVSIIMAFLLILFFERLHAEKDTSAGIALAFAAAIKGLPVVFVLYLIAKKRHKALLATLLCGATLFGFSLLFAGWDLHSYFLNQVTSNVGYAVKSDLGFDPSFHPANLSINGFIGIYLGAVLGPSKWLIAALCFGLSLPFLWLLWKAKTTVADDGVLLLVLLLLISPITWTHHMVVVILPATVFASRIVDGSWRLKWWPLIPVCFAVVLANDLGRPIMPIKFFPLLSHSRLFALIAIYIYTIVCIQQGKEKEAGKASTI